MGTFLVSALRSGISRAVDEKKGTYLFEVRPLFL